MSVPANLGNVRAIYGLARKILLQVLDKVKGFFGQITFGPARKVRGGPWNLANAAITSVTHGRHSKL